MGITVQRRWKNALFSNGWWSKSSSKFNSRISLQRSRKKNWKSFRFESSKFSLGDVLSRNSDDSSWNLCNIGRFCYSRYFLRWKSEERTLYNHHANRWNFHSVKRKRRQEKFWKISSCFFFSFGSFEIFKTIDPMTGRKGPSVGRVDILKTLLNYVISTFYPKVKKNFCFEKRKKTFVFRSDRRRISFERRKSLRSVFRRNC